MSTIIAKNVKRISKEKGISAEDIASSMNISLEELNRFFYKKYLITPEQLSALKTLLGVESKDLLCKH